MNYSATDAHIKNPERGFWQWHTLSNADSCAISGSPTPPEMTLIYAALDLSSFINQTSISTTKLNDMSNAFAKMRTNGVKCMVRPLYMNVSGQPDVTSVARVVGHLADMAPVFAANNDVIACYQAGCIGPWGEWHDYVDHVVGPPMIKSVFEYKAAQNQIIGAYLASTPPNSFLLLRRPVFKVQYLNTVGYNLTTGASPLNDSTAFQNTALARLGVFNDAFFSESDQDDMDTYKNWSFTDYLPSPSWTVSAARTIMAAESQFVPFGGENCANATPSTSAYAYGKASQAVTEMGLMHMNFLHDNHDAVILADWLGSASGDTMRRKMGYRFELQSATLPDAVPSGGTFSVSASIKNVGFSTIFNRRPVFLRLLNAATNAVIQDYDLSTTVDPRRWYPSASAYTLNSGTLTAPNLTGIANVKIALWTPEYDNSHSMRNNPAYSVRIASKVTATSADIWDATTVGWNVLSNGNIPASFTAPTGLVAIPLNQNEINVSWTDNSSDETNFVVRRATSSSGPFTDIATLAAGVNSYNSKSLTANTTYYYDVRAVYATGSSVHCAASQRGDAGGRHRRRQHD